MECFADPLAFGVLPSHKFRELNPIEAFDAALMSIPVLTNQYGNFVREYENDGLPWQSPQQDDFSHDLFCRASHMMPPPLDTGRIQYEFQSTPIRQQQLQWTSPTDSSTYTGSSFDSFDSNSRSFGSSSDASYIHSWIARQDGSDIMYIPNLRDDWDQNAWKGYQDSTMSLTGSFTEPRTSFSASSSCLTKVEDLPSEKVPTRLDPTTPCEEKHADRRREATIAPKIEPQPLMTPKKLPTRTKAPPPSPLSPCPPPRNRRQDEDRKRSQAHQQTLKDKRAKENEKLIELRAQGLTYEQCRRVGKFVEHTSTLRGRMRAIINPEAATRRKPKWTDRDSKLLREVVSKVVISTLEKKGRSTKPELYPATNGVKVRWCEVSKLLKETDGSYPYGPGSCSKRWCEMISTGKLSLEGKMEDLS